MRNVKKSLKKFAIAAFVTILSVALFSCKQSGTSTYTEVTLNAGNVRDKGTTKVYYSEGKWYEDSGLTVETTKIQVPTWNYQVVRLFEKNAVTGELDSRTISISENGYDKDNGSAAQSLMTNPFLGYGDIINFDGTFTKKAPSSTSYEAKWVSSKQDVKITKPRVADLNIIGENKEFKSYTVMKPKAGVVDGKRLSDYERGDTYELEERLDEDDNNQTILMSITDEVTYLLVNVREAGSFTVFFKDNETSSTGTILYYVNADGAWRSTPNTEGVIERSIAAPEKKQTVIFQGNSTEWANKTVEVKSKFLGYWFKNGDNWVRQYTDVNGVLRGLKEEELKEDLEALGQGASRIDVYARFEKGEGINLTALDINGEGIYVPKKSGQKFNGWYRNNDVSQEIIQTSDPFFPEESDGASVTLVAKWGNIDRMMLTLDPNGATTEGDKVLYNVASGNSWFKEASGGVAVNSITVPIKEWTVNFDANWPNAKISFSTAKYRHTFKGYYIPLGGSSSKEVINSVGNITSGALSSDSHAKAEWANDGYSVNNAVTFDESGKGVEFVGWSTTSGRVLVNDEKADDIVIIQNGGRFIPDRDNVTLYGVWRDTRKYKLELIKVDESETGSDVKEIWYSVGKDEWYKDSSLSERISVSNPIRVPERVWRVDYTANMEGVTLSLRDEHTRYEWRFTGYGDYITENGTMVDGVKIAKDERAVSKWEVPARVISLPTEADGVHNTSSGVSLSGWKKSKSGDEIFSGEFVPDSDNISFYGAWTDNRTVTINLRPSDALSPTRADQSVNWDDASPRQIFYSEKDNVWYREYQPEAGIKTIYNSTDFRAPVKKVTIKFNAISTGLPSGSDPEIISGELRDLEVGYEFLGFKGYIDKNGNLEEGVSATAEDNGKFIDASWGESERSSIDLPILSCDGYTFSGWKEEGGEDNPTKKYVLGKVTRPTITLTPVWESQKKHKVTLNGNGATRGETSYIYFREIDEAWLKNETDTNGITSLALQNLPKREWTVKFDKNGNTEAISLKNEEVSWSFLGYYDSPDGGQEYISKEGVILRDSIDRDIELYAHWEEKSNIVSITSLQGKVQGYKVYGWSKNSGAREDDSDLIKGNAAEFTTNDGNEGEKTIILYLIWDYERVYTLTLMSYFDEEDRAGAIYNFLEKEIYYRENDGWYSIKEESKDGKENGYILKNKIEKVSIPSKSRMITLDTKREVSEAISTTVYAYYPFLGYGRNGGSSYNITSDGVIKDLPSISTDQTMYASWGAIEGVALPSLTVKSGNYVFEGWSEDGKELSVSETNSYKPDKREVKLEARWRSTDTPVVTLNANGGENLSRNLDGTSRIYKNPNNGEWYYDTSFQSMVSGDLTAMRKVQVVFNNNESQYAIGNNITPLPNEDIMWEFKGYSIAGKMFIDEKGEVIGDISSQGETAYAIWGEVEETIDLNERKLECEEYPNWKFVGWSTESNKEDQLVLPQEYRPVWEEGYSGNNGKINLYAIWTDEKVYTIELDSNTEDDSVKNSTIVYRAKTGGYHTSLQDEDQIRSVKKPTKSWRITYDTDLDKSDVINDDNITFKFAGYEESSGTKFVKDGLFVKDVIDENGEFKEGVKPVSTLESGSVITLTAKWDTSTEITLPNTSRVGYQFEGWEIRGKDGSIVNAGKGGAKYTIDKKYVEANRIIFYGKWTQNNIYTLTIKDETGTSKGYERIYYRVGDGWYSEYDASSTGDKVKSAISRVLKPTRVWYVSFESMLDGVANPSQKMSESDFGGIYKVKKMNDGSVVADMTEPIALGDGAIVKDAAIDANTEAIVVWSKSAIITLPDTTEMSKENYSFVGWTPIVNGIDTNTATEDELSTVMSPGAGFTPEYEKFDGDHSVVQKGTGSIKLYGVWRDNRIFKLTLEGNGATSSVHTTAVYYKPQTKKWYLDQNGEGEATLTIRAPEKEWKIRYNTTWTQNDAYGIDTVDRVNGIDTPNDDTLTWTFGGYEAFITEKDTATSVDGDERYKVPDGGITSDRNVKAIWKEVNLTSDANNKLASENLSSSRWTFNGWSEEPSGNATLVANPYRPFDGDTKIINDLAVQGGKRALLQKDDASLGGTNYITLYAHWRGAGSKKIEFNHNGATSNTTDAIYYSIEKDNWYSDEGLRNRIDRIDVPKKVWTIKFDSNGTANESLSKEGDMSSEGKFLGYDITLPSGETYKIINSDGSINVADRKAITDYLKAEGTSDNIESPAVWDTMSEIILPSYLTRPGYALIGWMLTPNGVDTVGTDGRYTPEEGHVDKSTNSVVLYASYRKNAIYKLTLDGNGATNIGLYTQSLYYWVGKGWYREENPDTSSTLLKAGEQVVTIPIWDINVKYELNTGDTTIIPPSSFPQDGEKVARTFLGYTRQSASGNIGFISREGNLISTAILSEDLTLKASWGTAKSLKLPKGLSWEEHEFMGWSFSMEGGSTESGTFVKEIYTDYITLGERDKDWEQVKDNTVTFYAIWRSTRVFRVKLGTSGFYMDKDGNVTRNSVSSTSGGNAYIYYREADEDWFNDEVSADSRLNSVTIPQSIYTISFRTNNSAIAAPQAQTLSTVFRGYRFEGSQTLGNVEAGLWFTAQGVLDRDIATPAMKKMIEAGLRPTDTTSLVPLYDDRGKIELPNLPNVPDTAAGEEEKGGYIIDPNTNKGTKYYFYDWTTDANKTWNSQEDTSAAEKSIYPVKSAYTIRAANDVIYARIEDTTIYHVQINLNKGVIDWGKNGSTGNRYGDAVLQSDGTYLGTYLTTLSYKVSNGEWYANPIPYNIDNTTTDGKPNGKGIVGVQPYDSQRLSRSPWYISTLNSDGASNVNIQTPTRVDLIEFHPDYRLAMTNAGVTNPDSLWTLTTRTITGSGENIDYKDDTAAYTPSALDLEEVPMKEDYTWEFGGYKFTSADGKEYTMFDSDMNFVLDTDAFVPTGDFEITAEWKQPELSNMMFNSFPQLHIKETADSTEQYPKAVLVTSKPTGDDPEAWLTYELTQRQIISFTTNYSYDGPQSLAIKGWSNTGWTDDSNNANVGLEGDNRSTIASVTYVPNPTDIVSTYYYNNNSTATKGYRYRSSLYGTWRDTREYYFHLIADDEGVGSDAGVDDGFNYKFDETTETISGRGLPIVKYSSSSGWEWPEYIDGGFEDVSLTMTNTNGTMDNANVDMPLASKNFVISYDLNDTADGTEHPFEGTLSDENTKAGANFLGYFFIKKDFLSKGFTESTLPWPVSVPSSATEDIGKTIIDADGDFKLMTNDIKAFIDNNQKTVLGLYMLHYAPSKAWDNFTGYEDYTYKYQSDETPSGDPIFASETLSTIPVKAKWSQGNTTILLPTPATTERDGMIFQGWSASKTGEVGDTNWRGKGGATYKPTKSEKLYAVWYENVELIVKYKNTVLNDTDKLNYAKAISGTYLGEDDTAVTKQTGETFISDGKGIPIEIGLYKSGTNGAQLATKSRFNVLDVNGNIDNTRLSRAIGSYSSPGLGLGNSELSYEDFTASKEQDGSVRRIQLKVKGFVNALKNEIPLYDRFRNVLQTPSDYLQYVGNISGNSLKTPDQYGSIFISIVGAVEITSTYTTTADYTDSNGNVVTKGTVLTPYGTQEQPFRNPSAGIYSNVRDVHYTIKNARFKTTMAQGSSAPFNYTSADGSARVLSTYKSVSSTEIVMGIQAGGYSGAAGSSCDFSTIVENSVASPNMVYTSSLYGETVIVDSLVKINPKISSATNLGLEQTLTTNVYATSDGDKDAKKFFDPSKPTTFYAYWQLISDDEDTLIPEFKANFSENTAKNIFWNMTSGSTVAHYKTIDKVERLTPSVARKVTDTITETNIVGDNDNTHYNVLRYTISNFYVVLSSIGSSLDIPKSLFANSIDGGTYQGINLSYYFKSTAISGTTNAGVLPDFTENGVNKTAIQSQGGDAGTAVGSKVALGVAMDDFYMGITLPYAKFDKAHIGENVTWYSWSCIKYDSVILVDIVNNGKTAILKLTGVRVISNSNTVGTAYKNDTFKIPKEYIYGYTSSLTTLTVQSYHQHSTTALQSATVTRITGNYTYTSIDGTDKTIALASTGIVGPYGVVIPDFYMGFYVNNGAKFIGNSGVGAIGTNIVNLVSSSDHYIRGKWEIYDYNTDRTRIIIKVSGAYINNYSCTSQSGGAGNITFVYGNGTLINNYYGPSGDGIGSMNTITFGHGNTAYDKFNIDDSSNAYKGSTTYPLKDAGNLLIQNTNNIRINLATAYTYNFEVGDTINIVSNINNVSSDAKAYIIVSNDVMYWGADGHFEVSEVNYTESSKYIVIKPYGNITISELTDSATIGLRVLGQSVNGFISGGSSMISMLDINIQSYYRKSVITVKGDYVVDGDTYNTVYEIDGFGYVPMRDFYIAITIVDYSNRNAIIFNKEVLTKGAVLNTSEWYSDNEQYSNPGTWSVVGVADNDSTVLVVKVTDLYVINSYTKDRTTNTTSIRQNIYKYLIGKNGKAISSTFTPMENIGFMFGRKSTSAYSLAITAKVNNSSNTLTGVPGEIIKDDDGNYGVDITLTLSEGKFKETITDDMVYGLFNTAITSGILADLGTYTGVGYSFKERSEDGSSVVIHVATVVEKMATFKLDVSQDIIKMAGTNRSLLVKQDGTIWATLD